MASFKYNVFLEEHHHKHRDREACACISSMKKLIGRAQRNKEAKNRGANRSVRRHAVGW